MKQFPAISLALLLVCYAGFGWYLSGLELAQLPWITSTCYHITGQPIPSPARLDMTEGKKSTEPRAIEPRAIAEKEKTPSTQPTPAAETQTEKEKTPSTQPTPAAETQAEKDKISAGSTTEIQSAEKATTPPHATEAPDQTPNAVAVTPHGLDRSNFCDLAIRHNLPVGLIAVSWIFISAIAFISPLSSFNRFLSRWFQSDTVAFATIFLLAGMAAIILYWLHVALQILTILAAESLARIDIQIAGMSGLQAYWILTLVSLTGLIAGWLANGVL